MIICDRCGATYGIGDWPWCPHGRPAGTVVSDSIPGGQLIENLGPDPVRVYSETERRRIMKERGLVDYVRHRPGSSLTSNWDTVTQKTLDDATELLSPVRRIRVRADEPGAQVETLRITVTERGTFRVTPDGEPHR